MLLGDRCQDYNCRAVVDAAARVLSSRLGRAAVARAEAGCQLCVAFQSPLVGAQLRTSASVFSVASRQNTHARPQA